MEAKRTERYTADPRLTPEGLVVVTKAETYPVEPAPEKGDGSFTIPVLSEREDLSGAVVLGADSDPCEPDEILVLDGFKPVERQEKQGNPGPDGPRGSTK